MVKIKTLFDLMFVLVIVYGVVQGIHAINKVATSLETLLK